MIGRCYEHRVDTGVIKHLTQVIIFLARWMKQDPNATNITGSYSTRRWIGGITLPQ